MFDAKAFLQNVSQQPGVYQMLDVDKHIIYIGKAKNLKKRLVHYFTNNLAPKTKSLVAKISEISVTITHSENEALLLECNLIKEHRPRYNVLMRDDKSYPYITISKHKQYPRLDVYRGARHKQAEYFGPYPNVTAVRETIKLLQKIFNIRQCTDSFFRQRTRPCLQHQIGRCSAPCVKKIDEQGYLQQVQFARDFLKGNNQSIIDTFINKMEQASINLAFEQAARFRDIVSQLREVQSKQYVTKGNAIADVYAINQVTHTMSIAQLKIRQGQVVASCCFLPKVPRGADQAEVLSSFLAQYYLVDTPMFGIPKKIIVNIAPEEAAWLKNGLEMAAKRSINLTHNVKGEALKWLEIANATAHNHALQRESSMCQTKTRWQALQTAFSLAQLPRRIECFDISHHSGEATTASCVVFNQDGALKADYRRFSIKGVTAGDDYAAMNQALLRRYSRVVKEDATLPDIVLIDGGKGQLSEAISVFTELTLSNVLLIAIAKGPTRKAGLEQLFIPGSQAAIILASDNPALHLLQQIRDEAHRFAITGQRAAQKKRITTSALEHIAGVGPKRRRELLRQFGGIQALQKASIEEIMKVPGINKSLAEKIYLHFTNT